MIRIGVNGVGRIGKSIIRQILLSEDLELAAVNDINLDVENVAYILNYDSIYGKFEKEVTTNRKNLFFAKEIKYSSKENINEADWADCDIVIDSTGVASNVKNAKDLDLKTLITHSPDDVDFTMVLGANEEKLKKDYKVISSSICDTTAIAPFLKVISSISNINSGSITTLHPWLNYQNLLDGKSASWSKPGETYGHYELGRASIGNMIPKPTTALDATLKILPSLKESNLISFSYRTPHPIVSSADLTLNLDDEVSKDEIENEIKKFIQSQNYNIFEINNSPLVSSDFIGNNASCIYDERWAMTTKKTVKAILWYDNEWGYSSRVLDQVRYIFT